MVSCGRWAGVAEADDAVVYLAIPLRNVGSGIAVLHGWSFFPTEQLREGLPDPVEPEEFVRLTRDLYVRSGDVGFRQGTFRDPDSKEFSRARNAITRRLVLIIDLLYGDHEGGQRVVTCFALRPIEGEGWTATAARHWNLDRADPRQR